MFFHNGNYFFINEILLLTVNKSHILYYIFLIRLKNRETSFLRETFIELFQSIKFVKFSKRITN
jgi:hypothetical protein